MFSWCWGAVFARVRVAGEEELEAGQQRLRMFVELYTSTPFMAWYLIGTGTLPFMVICFPNPASFNYVIKLWNQKFLSFVEI